MSIQRSDPTGSYSREDCMYVQGEQQAKGRIDTHLEYPSDSRGSAIKASQIRSGQADHGTTTQAAPTPAMLNLPASPVRIMTFQEIAAIPAFDDGKPRVDLPATTTTRPQTQLLVRNNPPVGSFTDDSTMLYHVFHAGVIPDPVPHDLWTEGDSLINWYKAELTNKLNGLLDADMQRRSDKKKIIKNIKWGTLERGQHEDLIKWCRTGKHRQNIYFRLYDDWILRLNRFDFGQKDLSIIELMTLISEVHFRIHTNAIANSPASALLPSANTMRTLVVLNQGQMYSTTRESPQFGIQQSRSTRPIVPVRQETAHMSHNSFQVYRDEPASTTSQGVHQSNHSPFQDKTNRPGRGTPASLTAYDQPASMLPALFAATISQTRKHQADDAIEEPAHYPKIRRTQSPQSSQETDLVHDDLYITEDYSDLELPDVSPEMLDFVISLKKQEVLVILLRREVVPHEDLVEGDMCDMHLPPPPNTGAMNQWLDARLEPNEPKPQLFRNRDEPEANDFSQYARCVRFAKSPSQAKTDWRVHHVHVAEIYKASNRYGKELLRARADMQHPLPGGGDSLQEFETVTAIRLAGGLTSMDCTAAYVPQIAAWLL
jgi:hypothetical protein